MKTLSENHQNNLNTFSDTRQNDIFVYIAEKKFIIIAILFFAILIIGAPALYYSMTECEASNCTSFDCINGYKWVTYFGIKFCVTC